ncbi:unnamed protein product [Boreogadus saida]
MTRHMTCVHYSEAPLDKDLRTVRGGERQVFELRVRGGRLEVLAVRSVAVVWRRSLQMEGALQPKGCRTKD